MKTVWVWTLFSSASVFKSPVQEIGIKVPRMKSRYACNRKKTLTSSNNLVLTKVKDILYSTQDLLSFYNALPVEVWEETRASLPVFPRFARLILQNLFNVFICLLFGWKEILPSAEIPHENFSLILLTLIIYSLVDSRAIKWLLQRYNVSTCSLCI